jgi:copper chaperone CopZ
LSKVNPQGGKIVSIRRNAASAVVLGFLILVGGVAVSLAGDKDKENWKASSEQAKENAKPSQEMAIYSVPNIEDAKVVADLGKALAKQKGVLAAQADVEAKTFNVTFEPGKLNPDKILKVLHKVSKEIKFEKIVAAGGTAAGHDCGKCPNAKSCGEKK